MYISTKHTRNLHDFINNAVPGISTDLRARSNEASAIKEPLNPGDINDPAGDHHHIGVSIIIGAIVCLIVGTFIFMILKDAWKKIYTDHELEKAPLGEKWAAIPGILWKGIKGWPGKAKRAWKRMTEKKPQTQLPVHNHTKTRRSAVQKVKGSSSSSIFGGEAYKKGKAITAPVEPLAPIKPVTPIEPPHLNPPRPFRNPYDDPVRRTSSIYSSDQRNGESSDLGTVTYSGSWSPVPPVEATKYGVRRVSGS